MLGMGTMALLAASNGKARWLRIGPELPGRRPPEGQCPSGAHGEQKDVEGFRVGLGPALNASTPSEVMIE